MIYITALAVVCLDIVTKWLALHALQWGKPVEVVPGIFRITLVLNDGTAFGLFKGQRIFFIAVAVMAIIAIVLYAATNRRPALSAGLGLGLILGGAVGNLIDRLFVGRVIDFVDFRIWPVFNVADSAITIGATIIIIKMLFGSRTSNPKL